MLTRGIRLLQDSAPVHISHIAQMEAQSRSYNILSHSPYFTDLAPFDFNLLPVLKLFFRGKGFQNEEAVFF